MDAFNNAPATRVRQEYDIVVVGGGLAGLAFTRALRRTGLRVAVIDNQAQFSEHRLNYGNDLQPAALSALESLGLLGEVKHLGALHHRWYADKAGGENLACWDYSVLGHSHPYAICIRAHLLRSLLRDAVAELDTVDMLVPAEFVRMESEGGCHRVWLKMGDRLHAVKARLVVGSDGPHSRVRAAANIGCELQEYPYGWVDTILPRNEGEYTEGHVALGRGEYLGIVPTRAGELVTFHLTRARSQEEYERRMGSIDGLRGHYARLAPGLETSLEALRSWSQPLYMPGSRVRAHQWVADGVALAGEAALSVNPVTSQGAGLALENGVRLAAVAKLGFERDDLSRRALMPYEAWSRPEAEAIQAWGDLLLWVFAGRSPLISSLKEQMFRHAGRAADLRREVLAYSCGLHWLSPSFLALREWLISLRTSGPAGMSG